METILFLAHTQADGTLPNVARETLAAAVDLSQKLHAPLTVGLVGESVQAAADTIAGCGADRFLAVQGKAFAASRYASDAAAIQALCEQAGAGLILAPAGSRFSRVLPGVTQRLNGRIETHVNGIELSGDTVQIQRWYYRQRMKATLSRSRRPWFLLIDSGVFDAWQGEAGNASVENLEVSLDAACERTQVVGLQSPDCQTQTIRPDAKLLFVAGAGWNKKQTDGQIHLQEAENLILGFLDKGQASLGSSKSLVDQSSEGAAVLPFMTHLNQIGQTGSTPRHPKGLSTCCHGEEPHAVGWRFINDRRAINLDPNCGWAQGKADVLYVADAFAVMAKVNQLLEG
jgi:electron transfer flavoprotein alpha subunit